LIYSCAIMLLPVRRGDDLLTNDVLRVSKSHRCASFQFFYVRQRTDRFKLFLQSSIIDAAQRIARFVE